MATIIGILDRLGGSFSFILLPLGCYDERKRTVQERPEVPA
jgi:hypothetical protein